MKLLLETAFGDLHYNPLLLSFDHVVLRGDEMLVGRIVAPLAPGVALGRLRTAVILCQLSTLVQVRQTMTSRKTWYIEFRATRGAYPVIFKHLDC